MVEWTDVTMTLREFVTWAPGRGPGEGDYFSFGCTEANIFFSVDLQYHRVCVASIAYGKKLPDAMYFFRPREENVSLDVWNTICRAEIAASLILRGIC